ncbi:MAG: DUF4296 domain-containing protein [Bacteroidales bacterium]|nr:DUF4296 domain-containing protein [Bacteroidales bacterium]
MPHRTCPRIALLLVALAATLSGCRSRMVIPEDDMVRVLTKLYLTDATQFGREAAPGQPMLYYEPVLERYGYTMQQFDSSLRYYSSRPEVLDQIYDHVIGELTKLEAHIAEQAQRAAEEAARNLWPWAEHLSLHQADSMHNPHLRFEVQLPRPGLYALAFTLRRGIADSTIAPRFEAALWGPDSMAASAQSHPYPADTSAHELVFEFDAPDSSTTLRGALYLHANSPSAQRSAAFSGISLRYNAEAAEKQRLKKFTPFSLKRSEQAPAQTEAPQKKLKLSRRVEKLQREKQPEAR